MTPTLCKRSDGRLSALGEQIPSHWEVTKLGHRYEVSLGKMLDGRRNVGGTRFPYLRNQDVQWHRINTEGVPNIRLEAGEVRRYTIRDGDILVCEGGDVGRAAIWEGSSGEFAYQKALHRLRPLRRQHDEPHFMLYLLRAAKERGVYARDDRKATISHLTADNFRQYRFPFPPIDEQRRIAAYLDRETSQIDEIVALAAKSRETLLERRAALTHYAVDGSLSLTAREETRVPWLSERPCGWTDVQIRRVAKLGSGHTPSRSNAEYWKDCRIPWVTTGEVSQVRNDRVEFLYKTREKISELGMANSSATLHPAGTVFLSRTASAGFSGIMGSSMATSQDFVTWTCGPKLRPRFLLLCLRAMREDLLGRLAVGSTHKTIYMPDVEELMIPLPTVDEQDQIVEEAWRHFRIVDDTIDSLGEHVELLQERRAALILAAVTGQIDVSSWQPDETVEVVG